MNPGVHSGIRIQLLVVLRVLVNTNINLDLDLQLYSSTSKFRSRSMLLCKKKNGVPVSRVVKFNDDIIKTDVTVKLYNRKFLNFIIIGDLNLGSRHGSRQDGLTCMYS